MGNCCRSPVTPVMKSPKSSTTSKHRNGDGSTVGKTVIPNLKEFTYQELTRATNKFRADTVLGEGGFGKVYKGWIDGDTLSPSKASSVGVAIPIAVKRCRPNSSQGIKEWITEIEFLGKLSHPNLVRLIGYCWEGRELLLVYEYMQKGSLATHLYQTNREPLSWSTRIKIAKDAAYGLDFLHTNENVVIYRDFKPANILLDENYNAKLSDFGTARAGPVDKSHVTTQAIGTYGYVAPEYMNSNHLSVRSDVYSFGVVLLEMITGLKAYDSRRPAGQTKLVDWYKPVLNDMSKLKKMGDLKMQGCPPKAMKEMTQLISKCVQFDHKNRPYMSDVIFDLEQISAIKDDRKAPKVGSLQSKSNRQVKRPIRP